MMKNKTLTADEAQKRLVDILLRPYERRLAEIRFNPYHDEKGRFARSPYSAKKLDKVEKSGIINKKSFGSDDRLPSVEIPDDKFTKYALDPIKQPDKARAFKIALGYTLDNYQELIENIKSNFNKNALMLKSKDKFGERFELVMRLTGANGKSANVCTAWIKENENSMLRLTSAYVTKKKVTTGEN